MGFRFRKSIKLFPGVRVNFSKTGISTSIGKPGATINISERGTRTTVGIPGTGISYSESQSFRHADAKPDTAQPMPDRPPGNPFVQVVLGLLIVLIVVVVVVRW